MTAPKRKVKASDRLIAGFQNIVEFVETNRRLPQNCDKREERALYNQLKGILNDSKKKKRCKVYDTVGVLNEFNKTEEQQLDDILDDPIFADVEQTNHSLFDLPDYMKQRLEERKEADHVAQRIKCEDFNQLKEALKRFMQD